MVSTVAKVLIGLFAILNIKSLPFAYVIRFYSLVFRYLVWPNSQYKKTGKNTYGISASNDKLAVFTPVPYRSYVSPMEYDMNFHKSNSTYYIDLDFARASMLSKVFQKGFLTYSNNEKNEFKSSRLTNIPYVAVAGVDCKFKKELNLFQLYNVVSKVIAWDQKWLYVLSKFVVKSGKTERVHAIAVTKYVFKLGRLTISPEEMMERSDLLTEEAKEENAKHIDFFNHYVDLETLDEHCLRF